MLREWWLGVLGRHWVCVYPFVRSYEAVLAILDARGVEVPDEIHTNIASCTDLDQLDIWVHRAVVANKIQDLDDQTIG